MKMNFTERLERTPNSKSNLYDSIVRENKEFLKGKSLLEFGVWTGISLSRFTASYNKVGLDKDFYGFDSFQGLPEENLDKNNPSYWTPGLFSGGSTAQQVRNKLPHVKVVPGWFSDTLNQDLLDEVSKKEIGILHVDCDIYTSSMQVLEWVVSNNLLSDGTIVIYDDWGGHYESGVGEFECGEGKAHKDICEKYDLNFEFLSCNVIQKNYVEVCCFRYKK